MARKKCTVCKRGNKSMFKACLACRKKSRARRKRKAFNPFTAPSGY